MTHQAQAGDYRWPDHLVDAATVRAWISSVLPGQPDVEGPSTVLYTKVWSVSARFAVQGYPVHSVAPAGLNLPLHSPLLVEHTGEVVFKASYTSPFVHGPHVYTLLNAHAAGTIPRLLAWAIEPGSTWELFQPFDTDPVTRVTTVEQLSTVARTLASIQVAVAAAPLVTISLIPRLQLRTLPGLFDEILDDIHTMHLPVWTEDGAAMLREFRLPADILQRLQHFRSSVATWTAELEDGRWPDTVDHVDLSIGNSVLRPDGTGLIYDWDEAIIGSPFFSLNRLLDDARHLDQVDGRWPQHADDGWPGSPGEIAVQHAYVEVLPWGTITERVRALRLAWLLWPVKDAYECKVDQQARGRDRWLSRLTAIIMARALQRWQSGGEY